MSGSARRLRCIAAASGVALLALGPAAAVPPGPPGGTATRAVVDYSLLEERLAQLVQRGDRAGLEAVAADDFAFLAPGTADGLSRSEWIERSLRQPVARAEAYAIGVLERGELDLVSGLVRVERRVGGRRVDETAYIVDVWRHADRRLVSRYSSVPCRAPPPPKRPTGRN
jgi:hypothetical protein